LKRNQAGLATGLNCFNQPFSPAITPCGSCAESERSASCPNSPCGVSDTPRGEQRLRQTRRAAEKHVLIIVAAGVSRLILYFQTAHFTHPPGEPLFSAKAWHPCPSVSIRG
jgi:hypothetical protein